jgi:hypothetical protein
MKKIMALLIGTMVWVNIIKSQDSNLQTTDPQKSGPQNAIMVNPLGILATLTVEDVINASLSYEHKVTPKISCLVHLNVSNVVRTNEKYENGEAQAKLNYIGYGLFPEIRCYSGNTLYGPFIGLFGKFMVVTKKYYEYDVFLNSEVGQYAGAGGRIGYKFGGKDYFFEPSIVFGKGELMGFNSNPNFKQADISLKPVSTFWGLELKYGKYF